MFTSEEEMAGWRRAGYDLGVRQEVLTELGWLAGETNEGELASLTHSGTIKKKTMFAKDFV